VSISHAARQRPIRRGTLTEPPAPGTRPMPTSGSAKKASGAAVIRLAYAAISMPAPMQAPCAMTVTLAAIASMTRHGARDSRTR
jgi:hypothetical protein